MNAPKAKVEAVPIPGFGEGETIHVRQISAGERDEFEYQMQRRKGKDIRARLVILTACDPEGRRLFTDDDLPAIRNMPAAALEPIVEAHLRLNGSNADELGRLAEE